MKDVAIHRVGVRAALRPRNEPFWAAPLGTNQSLGYRKIDATRGAWIARRKKDGARTYKALGAETETFGFAEAREAARKWFADKDQGITGDSTTVADACLAYVKNLKDRKKPNTAHDADKRFERTVYKAPLGKVLLSDLRKHHLRTWITTQEMTPATLERTFTAIKAALNAAVRNELVSVTAQQAWVGLELPDVPDNRRRLFLDLKQRKALLAAAKGGLRDLMEACMVTGCRAGELTSALRGKFDERTGTMQFNGKTGARDVPLTPAALKLFKRLAENKEPSAHLLVRDDGKPWQHSDWDELVKDAAKAAGLPSETCLYTLRHSFITESISGGVATLTVARMTGTSIQMIEKHYGQFVHSAALKQYGKIKMI